MYDVRITNVWYYWYYGRGQFLKGHEHSPPGAEAGPHLPLQSSIAYSLNTVMTGRVFQYTTLSESSHILIQPTFSSLSLSFRDKSDSYNGK